MYTKRNAIIGATAVFLIIMFSLRSYVAPIAALFFVLALTVLPTLFVL